MEQFNADTGSYPAAAGTVGTNTAIKADIWGKATAVNSLALYGALINGSYLTVFPVPPTDGSQYAYVTNQAGSSLFAPGSAVPSPSVTNGAGASLQYILEARLEKGSVVNNVPSKVWQVRSNGTSGYSASALSGI